MGGSRQGEGGKSPGDAGPGGGWRDSGPPATGSRRHWTESPCAAGASAARAVSNPQDPRSQAPARRGGTMRQPSAPHEDVGRGDGRGTRGGTVGGEALRKHAVHRHHRGGAGHRMADVDADAGAVGEDLPPDRRTAGGRRCAGRPGWTQTTSSSSDQTAIRPRGRPREVRGEGGFRFEGGGEDRVCSRLCCYCGWIIRPRGGSPVVRSWTRPFRPGTRVLSDGPWGRSPLNT